MLGHLFKSFMMPPSFFFLFFFSSSLMFVFLQSWFQMPLTTLPKHRSGLATEKNFWLSVYQAAPLLYIKSSISHRPGDKNIWPQLVPPSWVRHPPLLWYKEMALPLLPEEHISKRRYILPLVRSWLLSSNVTRCVLTPAHWT